MSLIPTFVPFPEASTLHVFTVSRLNCTAVLLYAVLWFSVLLSKDFYCKTNLITAFLMPPDLYWTPFTVVIINVPCFPFALKHQHHVFLVSIPAPSDHVSSDQRHHELEQESCLWASYSLYLSWLLKPSPNCVSFMTQFNSHFFYEITPVPYEACIAFIRT